MLYLTVFFSRKIVPVKYDCTINNKDLLAIMVRRCDGVLHGAESGNASCNRSKYRFQKLRDGGQESFADCASREVACVAKDYVDGPMYALIVSNAPRTFSVSATKYRPTVCGAAAEMTDWADIRLDSQWPIMMTALAEALGKATAI